MTRRHTLSLVLLACTSLLFMVPLAVSAMPGTTTEMQTGTLPDRLFFSTVFGSRSNDEVVQIEIADNGDIYVLGKTLAQEWQGATSYVNGTTLSNIFVGRLRSDGSGFEFFTILPGSNNSRRPSLAVDPAGAVYVAGNFEEDFPITPGALRIASPVDQARVFKLSANGELIYSANLGLIDAAGLAVDDNGAAYVAGSTAHWEYPTTPGAYRRTADITAGRPLVIKLNPQGSRMEYATYIAPANDNAQIFSVATAIAVDALGNAYVTGTDKNPAFPTTPGAYVSRNPLWDDVFVVKLNAAGSDLIYSSVFGGESDDESTALAVDDQGAAYIVGSGSSGFPYHGELLTGSRNGFLAKLSPDGSQLLLSERVGAFVPEGLSVDASGAIYLHGQTRELNLPVTADALSTSCSNADTPECSPASVGAIAVVASDGRTLNYLSYFGPDGSARANAISVNSQSEMVIGGSVRDLTQIPVTTNLLESSVTTGLAFIMKLGFGSAQPPPRPTPTPTPIPAFDLDEYITQKAELVAALSRPSYEVLGMPLLIAPGYNEAAVIEYLNATEASAIAGTLSRQQASGLMRLTLQEEAIATIYHSRMVAADDRHTMTFHMFSTLLDIGDLAEGEFASLGLVGERLTQSVRERGDQLMDSWVTETSFGQTGWPTTAWTLRTRLQAEPDLRQTTGQALILLANHQSLSEFVENSQPAVDRSLAGALAMDEVDISDDAAIISEVGAGIAALETQAADRHEAFLRSREILDGVSDITGDAGQLGGAMAALDIIWRMISAVTEAWQVATLNLRTVAAERQLLCDSELLLFPQISPSEVCGESLSDASSAATATDGERQESLRQMEAALTALRLEMATPAAGSSIKIEAAVEEYLLADAGLSEVIHNELTTDIGSDTAWTALAVNYEVSMLRLSIALLAGLAAPDDSQAATILEEAFSQSFTSLNGMAEAWSLDAVVTNPTGVAAGTPLPSTATATERTPRLDVPSTTSRAGTVWPYVGAVGLLLLVFTIVGQQFDWLVFEVIGERTGAIVSAALGCIVIAAGIGLLVGGAASKPEQLSADLTGDGEVTGEPAVATESLPTISPSASASAAPDTATPRLQPTATMSPTLTATPTPTATPTSTPTIVPTPALLASANVFAIWVEVPPIIDGQPADWQTPNLYLSNNIVYQDSNWDGSEDLTVLWQLAWDFENLYLLVIVEDDVHVQNESGARVYLGDSLELQFDTNLVADAGIGSLSPDDFQVALSPGNFVDLPPSAFRNQGTAGGAVQAMENHQIRVAATANESGYILEAAIPWVDIAVSPVGGLNIGLALSATDNDRVGTAVQEVMYSNSASRTLSNPTTWGTLTLIGTTDRQ